MYQLTGFSDSGKFTIINSVPYFNCTGKTYLEKLKNRISLDYYLLLNQETIEEVKEKRIEETIKETNVSEKFDTFELDEPIINSRKRKERKGIKRNNTKKGKDKFIEKELKDEKELKEKRNKIGKKNIKKNVRQKGYSHKLFLTEQLPREDEEDDYCEMWDEEFYLRYIGYYDECSYWYEDLYNPMR